MKIKKIFILMFIMIFLFTGQLSYGENADSYKNVYIIVTNKLTIPDIEIMPNLKRIIDEGNIGCVSTRGVNSYKNAESFATINSSTKTYAKNYSSEFYNLNSEYKKIYENRVGKLDGEYSIGNIEIGKLYNQNENNNYSPKIGALGDRLHEFSLKTAIFGNSDTDEKIVRKSALIPMDSRGLIDYGEIEDILIDDSEYPYGLKTNYKKILNDITTIKSKASLIVVDTGDLDRLSTYGNSLSLDMFDSKRENILNDIDNFIEDLSNDIDKEKSLLIVLSPNSGEERIDGSRLSPIILWGKDIKKDVVTSSTTNRTGIISNVDIGPTITTFLGLPLTNMTGNPIKSVEKNEKFDYIKDINNRINITSKVRSKTLLSYAIISIIILLVTVLIMSLKINIENEVFKLLKVFLIMLYGIPIIFILSSLFKIDSLLKFFVSLFIGLILLILAVKRIDNKNLVYLLSFFYIAIFVVDLLLNGIITRFSVLSHDPIIGARYFGMGNEMMGIFLALSTIVSGILYKKFNKKTLSVLFLLTALIMVAHPRLGANVGGTIALFIAFIYFILNIIEKHLDIKTIILIGIIFSFTILIFGYIDITFNPNTTHLGKTLSLLKQDGISVAKDIINRKLLMNIKLIGVSIWTKVLFVNLFVQIIVSYIYKNKISKLMSSGLGKGIISGIVGSGVGLLVNDSGIMLSAISMNFITIFILFTIIHESQEAKVVDNN